MAARPSLPTLRHSIAAIGGFVTISTVLSKPIYAEEPVVHVLIVIRPKKTPRKSIYDDLPPPPSSSHAHPHPALTTPSIHQSYPPNSPTMRLAAHIRTARLALHDQIVKTQHTLDTAFDKFISTEREVTDTVASVAPRKTSDEQLIPGTLFVAVSTMAGAIISRRRLFPVRVLTPVVTGVAASWYFLPETTRNVADLLWVYEKKVPQVAEAHLATRRVLEDSWRKLEESTRDGRKTVEGSVAKARSAVEDWVSKQ